MAPETGKHVQMAARDSGLGFRLLADEASQAWTFGTELLPLSWDTPSHARTPTSRQLCLPAQHLTDRDAYTTPYTCRGPQAGASGDQTTVNTPFWPKAMRLYPLLYPSSSKHAR